MATCQICGTSTGDRSRWHRSPDGCIKGIEEAITDAQNSIWALKTLRRQIKGMGNGDKLSCAQGRSPRVIAAAE